MGRLGLLYKKEKVFFFFLPNEKGGLQCGLMPCDGNEWYHMYHTGLARSITWTAPL